MEAVDRSEWGKGPWEDELDRYEFTDLWTELPCVVQRHEYGHLCGYVGVSLDSPLVKVAYCSIPVDVHGGLTSAGRGDGEKLSRDVYWFGFDCGHGGDWSPAVKVAVAGAKKMKYSRDGEEYHTVEEVKKGCHALAYRLRELEHMLKKAIERDRMEQWKERREKESEMEKGKKICVCPKCGGQLNAYCMVPVRYIVHEGEWDIDEVIDDDAERVHRVSCGKCGETWIDDEIDEDSKGNIIWLSEEA